ncbi:MAG: hypothetical protein EOP36_07130 [Rubrivivax sp.]|nr:MAG: hypothetical protein EOP36_07130 [Rubrivivax sp.]
MRDATLVPLNRSEHMYWAGEGYLGPINMPFMMRFDRPVDEALLRQALRELTTAFPRMRGVIVPTAFTYKLRILPDDAGLEQLFDDAYRVQSGLDATSRSALEHFHSAFINEPLSLERGLPWRARFIPHAQTPLLVFSVHHIIGDGRSIVQMLAALLGRLSGQPIRPVPLESSSMVAAVTPHKWTQWPASIQGWWRNHQSDAQSSRGQKIITLASRRSERYTTTSVRYHELPCTSDQLKVIAKQTGTTLNNLVVAVMANAFLTLAPGDPHAVSAIRISVDLRRYFPEGQQPEFGNFVSSFTVRSSRQDTLAAQVQSVEGQVKDHLSRYEKREYALPLMFYEALPWLGRNLYSHLIVKSKAKGTLPVLSCHFTNLGNVEAIHPKDAQVRFTEIWPATLSTALLLALVNLGGKLFFTVAFQNDETDESAVLDFFQRLDHQFRDITSTPPPNPVA